MFLNTGNSFFKVKTKLISGDDSAIFERSLNEFIKDKKVLDIQYKALKPSFLCHDRALVIYVDEPPVPERDTYDLCPYWNYRLHKTLCNCDDCMEGGNGIMIDGDRYCKEGT